MLDAIQSKFETTWSENFFGVMQLAYRAIGRFDVNKT